MRISKKDTSRAHVAQDTDQVVELTFFFSRHAKSPRELEKTKAYSRKLLVKKACVSLEEMCSLIPSRLRNPNIWMMIFPTSLRSMQAPYSAPHSFVNFFSQVFAQDEEDKIGFTSFDDASVFCCIAWFSLTLHRVGIVNLVKRQASLPGSIDYPLVTGPETTDPGSLDTPISPDSSLPTPISPDSSNLPTPVDPNPPDIVTTRPKSKAL